MAVKPFPIPVISELPFLAQEEEPLEYLARPGEMAVFKMPVRRSPTALADERAACEVLETLLAGLRAYRFGDKDPPRLGLDGMDPSCLRAVNETLGEGEVSAMVGTEWAVQETAFAGIWRVCSHAADGSVLSDAIEACAIPNVVWIGARGKTRLEIPEAPPGVMNSPALLHEIAFRTAAFRERGETHVMNLSLLPVTPEDLNYMDAVLGRGQVSILSRGYGNCRITATALDGVWWVQYFNSSDALILNTLEIVEVPEAALAAAEDLADSLERLGECLSAMREGLA